MFSPSNHKLHTRSIDQRQLQTVHRYALPMFGFAFLLMMFIFIFFGNDSTFATPAYANTNELQPLHGAVQLVAGELHTCALTDSGGVVCWGDNRAGQFGDNTGLSSSTAVSVSGLSNGVSMIASGLAHMCALLSTGGVKCWGSNRFGELGDGTNTTRYVPTDVVGLNSGVVAISAGGLHTCAVLASGKVKCWGSNGYGQIGDGTSRSARLVPVDVYGLNGEVKSIAAGMSSTCALLSTGGIKCWGSDGYWQLGVEGYAQSEIPMDVPGFTSGVISITSGYWHICAIITGNGLKCWGWNEYGQIGNNTQDIRSLPIDVIGLGSGVNSITAGMIQTCAVLDGGNVKCWGWVSLGQSGEVSATTHLVPSDVVSINDDVTTMAAGMSHLCFVNSTSNVKCWGRNFSGESIDDSTWYTTPVTISVESNPVPRNTVTVTPTPTNTGTSTATPPPTATNTATPSPTNTTPLTLTPTKTASATRTLLPTRTPIDTSTPTATKTLQPESTATISPIATATGTETVAAPLPPTATPTQSLLDTATPQPNLAVSGAALGSSGSGFVFNGVGFPIGSQQSVYFEQTSGNRIGTELVRVGFVQTDANGSFTLILATDFRTAPGTYQITIGDAPRVSTQITIDKNGPLLRPAFSGQTLTLTSVFSAYLPVILR